MTFRRERECFDEIICKLRFCHHNSCVFLHRSSVIHREICSFENEFAGIFFVILSQTICQNETEVYAWVPDRGLVRDMRERRGQMKQKKLIALLLSTALLLSGVNVQTSKAADEQKQQTI